LLVLFCTAVGIGLGYFYNERQPEVFQSSARILVIKEETSQLPVNFSADGGSRSGPGGYEDVATQMLLIRSPLIIKKAVLKRDLGSLRMLSDGGDPVSRIVSALAVKQSTEKSNVMDISVKGADSDDCQKVLGAIIDSYEEFLHETHHNVSQETVDLITQAKEILLKELTRKEEAYRKFREETPLIWTKEGTLNVHRSRLAAIESKRSELIISHSQTKAQLQALEDAIKRGGSQEALLLMLDKSGGSEVTAPGSRSSVAKELFPLLLEEQMLLEDHGPDHPKVRNVRKKIDVTRRHLRTMGLAEEHGDETENGGKKSQSVDFITVYLDSLREDLTAVEQKLSELDDLFKKEADGAKDLAAFEVRDESMTRDISRTSQLFDGVVKRLEEINLIQDYGKLKTRVLQDAGPGYKVAPILSRSLGAAGALGLLLGWGIALMIEMSDKRFRSPEEIAVRLGIPVIGHIPYFRPEKADKTSPLDASLCVYHRPKSRFAEAYRGIRTALYFSTRGDGHKVVQVSSPNPGDGKSTMAANLAIAIAQSGKRILLVESDFRRPRVHRLFGIDCDVGVTTVIAGESELSDAIQSTVVENLSILPCGRRPSNPSEILSSQRYAELVDVLREKFDYVIIDTPPLMAVTDPAVVAPRVDGVLIAIRINKRSQHDCIYATELLSSVGATILGISVNGLNQKDAYGYGAYGNSYYGKSTGRYGRYNNGSTGYTPYGYTDSKYTAYYTDDEADEVSAGESNSA